MDPHDRSRHSSARYGPPAPASAAATAVGPSGLAFAPAMAAHQHQQQQQQQHASHQSAFGSNSFANPYTSATAASAGAAASTPAYYSGPPPHVNGSGSGSHGSSSSSSYGRDPSSTPDTLPSNGGGRVMPASFDGSMRHRAGGGGRPDEEALLGASTPDAKSMRGAAATKGGWMARARRLTRRTLRRMRKFTLADWGKLALALLGVGLLLRLLLRSYQDMHKSASFTIVSVLRDMSPESAARDPTAYAFQYTALQSWAALVVRNNVVVFADNEEQCGHVRGLAPGVQCLPISCWHPEFHKPQLDCIFREAHQAAPTDIIAFVDSNLALYSDLADAVDTVAAQKDKFAMVGRRVNTLVLPVMLDDYRSPTFLSRLRVHAARSGVQHSSFGIDCVVYRKKALEELVIRSNGAVGEVSSAMPAPKKNVAAVMPAADGPRMPAFIAGVSRWDNWLLSQLILDDSVAVVDMSAAVLLVHQSRGQVSTPDPAGAPYNDQLAKTLSGTNYKIGTINNADFVLQGPCTPLVRSATGVITGRASTPSLSGCALAPNQNASDIVMFTRKASANGYLVVLTVNHNYINLALNWVCWAERIKFTNYILIAEDQSSATNFKKRGVAVIVRHDAPWIKKAGDYGSVEFQETMTFRTEFLMSVLHAGFHFVTADMDGLWLDDPIPYFNDAADLQGQMHKVTKISGGLVIVRATDYGRYFWNLVIECQRGNAIFLASARPGSYVSATYTEQYCINQLSLGLAAQPLFSRSLLDPWLFPDGKSFFDERQSQFRGVWPAIIHNNWIVGTGNKIKRLHDWNLASADEELGQCHPLDVLPQPALPHNHVREAAARAREEADAARAAMPGGGAVPDPNLIAQAPPPPPPAPPAVPWETVVPWPFDLKIRVMAARDGAGLRALLDSLAATDFEGDAERISLEISIDHPGPSPSEEDMRGWNAVNAVASQFVWNGGEAQRRASGAAGSGGGSGRGEKTIIEQASRLGAVGQWLRGWTPPAHHDNELMLFLAESTVLAPGWYKWAKRALLQYYAHPEQFDPRLMGIALTPQGLILGETHASRFGGTPGPSGAPLPVSDATAVGADAGASNLRTPREAINGRERYYKSQLFSQANTAQILLPQHWRRFLAWLDEQKVDTRTGAGMTGASPCVPTLVSNRWHTDASAQHWYQWLLRFVFDEGYYFLYTNFDDRASFALPQSVANGRSQLKLVEDLSSVSPSLPSGPTLSVYDFHFNHVSTADVLAWRRHIVAPAVMPQCWTMDQLEQKIRDDEAAAAEALRIKEEEKAAKAAAIKAAREAEKARVKAEKDAVKAKEKAEKDAAAKAKKEAEDKIKLEKEKEKKAAAAAAAEAKKKADAAAAAKKKADEAKKKKKKKPAPKKKKVEEEEEEQQEEETEE